MLSEKDIEKYRELYKKRFKKEISIEKAREDGDKLIDLMKLVYKRIPTANKKMINNI